MRRDTHHRTSAIMDESSIYEVDAAATDATAKTEIRSMEMRGV